MPAANLDVVLCQCRLTLKNFRSYAVLLPSTRRSFSASTTRRKNGELPTFSPTESTELDTLLSTIRRQIFLPFHLSTDQRKLVYRKKNHAMITSDPFFVEIGDESVQLLPSVMSKDIPDSWKSMLESLRLMGNSQQSWRNFPALLTGMHTAKRRWTPFQHARIIRIAGEHGMAHMVLEALKQVDSTGLKLNDLLVVREAMWACRQKAVLGHWEEKPVAAALNYALQIAELLEDKRHQNSQTLLINDPRVQPDIIAVITELTAAKAALHQGCQDKDGLVQTFSQRLTASLSRGAPLEIPEPQTITMRDVDNEISRMIPVWNGLFLSQKVLGDKVFKVEDTRAKYETLTATLSKARSFFAVAKGPYSRLQRRSIPWLFDASRFTSRQRWPTKEWEGKKARKTTGEDAATDPQSVTIEEEAKPVT